MTLSVHGVHCDLGQAIKKHAEAKLASLDEKYFGRGLNASVTISKTEKKLFRTNIVYHTGNRDYQAEAVARDAHVALEKASNKLGKQLRRMKAKMRDNHHNREKLRLDETLNESLAAT